MVPTVEQAVEETCRYLHEEKRSGVAGIHRAHAIIITDRK